MPYQNVKELPESVRSKIKDANKLRQFMHVVNSSLQAGKPESVAFASAWAAVQKEMHGGCDDVEDDEEEEGVLQKIYTVLKREFGGKEQNKELPEGDSEWSMNFDIQKLDEDQRLIYGWASIIEENGNIVVDKQGDIIETQDLVNAAHDYISESREAHEMHEGVVKGKTVESIVFTKEVQKALGIDLNKVGWFICQKIDDDNTWEAVKSGRIKSFSIGGHGKRIPVK